MQFTLLNQDLQAFDEDWFQIKLLEGEEEFKFELTQNPLFTKVVVVDLYLQVKLVDHSQSESALIPVKVSLRECVPTDFEFGTIANELMSVGDDAKVIAITHSQQPCEYQVDYIVGVKTEAGRDPLPDFISFDQTNLVLSILKPNEADIGEYLISLEA